MRRALGFLLPLALSVVAPACASPTAEADEGESDESAYTANDAACFDEAARGSESKTDARARCLTAYAARLIDEQIARREDPRDAALASFKNKLRVPGETGCFTEDVSAGWTGAWQYDIDSKRDVGMLGVQLKAAVEFLKYFHRDLDGYPNHLFDGIELCPQGQVGADLALTGSRLRVGVRTGWGGRVGLYTSSEVREKWTKGEHLANNPALSKLGGLRWAMLDPVGSPRTTLRRALRRIVTKLRDGLGALAGRDDAAVRTELSRMIREEVLEGAHDDQDRSIRDRAIAKVAELSGTALTDFVAAWKASLAKVDLQEGAEEGTVSMQDVLNVKDVKVKVNQVGLVNVNNYKQISVDTELFLPNGPSFSRYVDVQKSETTVEVNQFGLVNVQLNDVITVRVQVLYGRTAQTASLDRVLGP